jgi:hypothetical protein
MVRHIDSLVVVWRLAEVEASHLGSKQIEPPHLFLGLLKIVDLDISRALADTNVVQVDAVLREVQKLRDCFGEFVLDSTRIRRRLRRYLRSDPVSDKPRHLRRSASSREIFATAETLSGSSEGIVHPLHLLVALLRHQDATVEGVLEETGCFPSELRRYAESQLSKLHRI